MTRATKRTWLNAGLEILAQQGAPALTIERLAERLGLTKGSFYHHFQGLPTYKAALLDYLEAQCADQLCTGNGQTAPSVEQIRCLFEMAAIAAPDVEVAVRAWSLQDEEVRQVQERVDSRRIAFSQAALRPLTEGEERALMLGRLAYALMVGSTQIQPPLSPDVRRQLFHEFLQRYQLEAHEQV
jgi:AcrR family transcriptional regulator